MPSHLSVSVGQYSDKGRKDINQDFHGVYLPREPQLSAKGIAIALADGISSSAVSQIASETAIKSFFTDYFCTSEAWSVKKSAERVLHATNAWLHSMTRHSHYRYERDKGYVCTFSAVIIKSMTAHIFHIGDARIYRMHGNRLEHLTTEHRHVVSPEESYLSRALGIEQELVIDYESLPIAAKDFFILTTDGVYEYVTGDFIVKTVHKHDGNLDDAAKAIVDEAYAQGSPDNLTVQILRIEELPSHTTQDIYQQLTELPFPPQLEARALFDGFQIIRELHATSRSHVYLALDGEMNEQVVIKTPSIDLREDPAYLERFLMEEWIARRINSAYVLKPCRQTRKRNFMYIVTEYIEGQTLAQWMIDNPKPDIETVRDMTEQISRGLLAFHRMDMLHQDLRPANIMIDTTGTVKIIDFGSTRVAGIMEMTTPIERSDLLGTAQYTAPEYFLGESGTTRSDMFSLAVIVYQMLTGKLPYGSQVAKSRTRAAQNRLIYHTVLDDEREIPAWIDDVLRKALSPNPHKRYAELSEFIYDLRHPNKAFLNKTRAPLMERNPVLFWKCMSAGLLVIILMLLAN